VCLGGEDDEDYKNSEYGSFESLPCGHQLHSGCGVTWFQFGDKCPSCLVAVPKFAGFRTGSHKSELGRENDGQLGMDAAELLRDSIERQPVLPQPPLRQGTRPMNQSGLGSFFGIVEPQQQLPIPGATTRNQRLEASLGIVLSLDESPPVSVQLQSPASSSFSDAEDIFLAWILGQSSKRHNWANVERTWTKIGRYIKHADPSVAIWARKQSRLKNRWSNSRASRKSH
jgi:hypothetical protein